MKYVKLFESWLNAVNEDITGKFYQESIKYDLDSEKSYASDRKTFANEIVKLVKQLTKGEDVVNLTPSVKGKDIILSLPGDKDANFKFRYDKTGADNLDSINTFDGVRGLTRAAGTINMLLIMGSGKVSTSYSDNTTFAQFLDSIVSGKDLEDAYKNEFQKAAESLLQMSMGVSPKLTGKAGKKTIAKMTIDDFKALTREQVKFVFSNLLKVEGKTVFSFANDKKDRNFFFINLDPKFAKSEGITFDDDSDPNTAAGRHLVFQLNLSDAKDQDSFSKCPITYGLTSKNESTSFTDLFNVAEETNTGSSSGTYQQGSRENATIASFIVGLRKFVEGGLKMKDGKKVADSSDFLISVDEQIRKTSEQIGSDAWNEDFSSISVDVPSKGESKA